MMGVGGVYGAGVPTAARPLSEAGRGRDGQPAVLLVVDLEEAGAEAQCQRAAIPIWKFLLTCQAVRLPHLANAAHGSAEPGHGGAAATTVTGARLAMAVLSLAALMLALPLRSSAAGIGSARLDLHECYDMLLEQPAAVPSSSSSSSSSQQLPVNCEGSQGGPRGMDTCFLLCGFCAVPSLRFGLSVPSRELYCGTPPSIVIAPQRHPGCAGRELGTRERERRARL
eukprot:COSAG01_NODE_11968_length_1825_cov_1.178447_1_plen_225_part_10